MTTAKKPEGILATMDKAKDTNSTPPLTFKQLIEKWKPDIERALPKYMDAERVLQIATTTVRRTPELMKCTASSLIGGIIQGAQLGLELGLLGECYLVPFRNNKRGIMEAQFIIGFKGMLKLVRNSGDIKAVLSSVVHSNDIFFYKRGLESDEFEHVPWDMREDTEAPDKPGEIRGVYLIVRLKDGGYIFHHMTQKRVEMVRARSKAKDSGPWVTDYEEMMMKTIVRYCFNRGWLPCSVEAHKVIAGADETVKSTIDPNMAENVLDEIEYEVVETEVAEEPGA